LSLSTERPPTSRPAPQVLPAQAEAAVAPARTLVPVPMTGRRVTVLVTCWVLVVLLGISLVAAALGALAETRSQRSLLTTLRQQVGFAEAASRSPLGVDAASAVPAPGSGVALLQVPRLGLQRVVVEGARAGDTQAGPGHVPGTAGLGQAGNSVVVGRRTAYGAAFSRLGELRAGDALVVTTVQGQSVYRVTGVQHTSADVRTTSNEDRLTLATASGRSLLGWQRALVVTAALEGKPFVRTPQGSRSDAADGRHGDGAALPTVIVWGTLLVLGGALTVLLYRRWMLRSTYLLTTPALVALTVLTGDAAMRLLPAWV